MDQKGNIEQCKIAEMKHFIDSAAVICLFGLATAVNLCSQISLLWKCHPKLHQHGCEQSFDTLR